MIAVGKGMNYYPKDFVYKGYSLGDGVWLGRKSKGYFFCGNETTRLAGLIEHMKKELLKDPLHIVKVREEFDKRVKEKEAFMNVLSSAVFSKYFDKELLDVYNGIMETYCYVYPYGEPVTFMTKDFAGYMKPRFVGKDEDFYAMIAPREKSFLQREDMDILKIAIIAKDKGIEKVSEMLKEHRKKYEWLPYDYGANHYDLAHFERELKKLLELSIDELKKRYDSLKGYEENIIIKQDKIRKDNDISDEEDKLYNVVRESYYLIDSKKEYFTKIHWYSERVFSEIAKRIGVDIDIVRHFLPDETKKYLIKKELVDKDNMKRRIENYYFLIKDDGTYDFYEDGKAKSLIDEFLEHYERSYSDAHVKGMTAQKGVVTGRARVITSALYCHRVKHGDILITHMTSPDFMVAVKRASAIVTDEGGVTCHAAIVSRELKIPCVIGTKDATKVFKDVDEIEVDADKGIVRKIG
jgi:phosphohistidine swiveling domain-containing protein